MGNAASTKARGDSLAISSGDVTGFLEEARDDFTRKWDASTTNQYVLDDYDRIKTLGTGSFGRVMLVRNKITNAMFAMKILEKAKVVKLKQVEHTLNEKRVLKSVNFPFLVGLESSFKDNANLYLVLEFIQGGEMFSHLRKHNRFP